MTALLLLAATARGACPDLASAVDRALAGYLAFDTAESAAGLADARLALDCGPAVDPPALARLFLVEGAVALVGGDQAAAEVAMAAARRCDRLGWIDALGDDARLVWELAEAAPGTAELTVAPPARDRVVVVDGTPREPPYTVSPGLHAVQVLDPGGVPARGLLLAIAPGETQVVQVRRPGPPVEAPPGGVAAGRSLALWTATGAAAAFGEAYRAGDLREPAVKVVIPLEVGLAVEGPVAARAALLAAPVLGGRLVWNPSGRPGDDRGWPALLGVQGAVTTAGRLRAGAQIGARLPGRLAGEAIGAWRPEPLWLELRAGVQLPTGGRSPEPIVGLAVGWAPRLGAG